MAKRMFVMLAAMAALVAALGVVKYQQVQAAIAGAAAFAPPPEAVTTVKAVEEPWEETLDAIGSAAAVQGVTVSADLPGLVSRIAFQSGARVGRGDVLVELDARQERAQLRAARSARDLARTSLARVGDLRQRGVTSQAELDDAQAAFEAADARVAEIEAVLERKTIRAPFAGTLGIRLVDLGQYLESGQPVVPLQSLDPIHVDFSVPQQEIEHLNVGTEVAVRAGGPSGPELSGRVTAVDSLIDEATRNVRVQALVPNPEGRLRPGMFVETLVRVGRGRPAVTLPATAVSYAPYGDSVFIVEDVTGPDGKPYRGVRQQFVRLGGARGDQVAVVSGVKPGEEVATSGVFKLRNGAAVHVDNSIQPSNQPAPRPEES